MDFSGRNSTAITNQTDTQVVTGAGRYFGIVLKGSAASFVNVYDGLSAAGELIDTIAVTSTIPEQHHFGPNGIAFTQGLFVDVDANSATVVVYW